MRAKQTRQVLSQGLFFLALVIQIGVVVAAVVAYFVVGIQTLIE